MNTDEKIKLLTDVHAAKGPLSRIPWDGGRKPDAVPERVRDVCMVAMAGLSMMEIRLVEEIGTDNL